MIDSKLTIFLNILEKTTNSYKFIFLLSLLDQLKEFNFEKKDYKIDDLIILMLSKAWYPAFYFKLNHGKQDQIYKYLAEIEIDGNTNQSLSEIFTKIKKQISKTTLARLQRHVVFRLLRPFFDKEMKGMKDQKINSFIITLSNNFFDSKSILYRIDTKHNQIHLHQYWIKTIQENYVFIRSWVLHEYNKYLQKHNPISLSIVNKLEPPKKRINIPPEIRKLWVNFINNSKTFCIFTNGEIKDNFDIDHYLPWSFVTHNEIWNLIPISSSFNRSKSNMLPNEKTLIKFIDLQYRFFCFLEKNNTTSSRKQLDVYFSVLNFEHAVVTEKNFQHKMKELFGPMFKQAQSMGFMSLDM